MLGPNSPISRPRPPSQTRRPSNMPAVTSPARPRTQSHTPSRGRPATTTEAPPPYTKESTEKRPNPRHSLTEIDDMLNVAGSVVRNSERELDAAALASRSLLEENKRMFAMREALLARLPISPRNSLSSPSPPIERQHTHRSSSWSTCSDDSDHDNSTATATPFRDMTVPLPHDPLEAHRVVTPTHSASNSIDVTIPFLPPAARLVPTQAERIAALHAGLVSPSHPPRPRSAASRRVSVSPAAVSHLQDANAALLARVQELEEATAKAQTDGAARMRRLQAEAESLRARLGEAEEANEGLRTEAEQEKEKRRVRAQSAGARQYRQEGTGKAEETVRDFAPSATWRPDFRSLRGGSPRPAVPARATTMSPAVSRGSRPGASPARAQSSISASTPTSTPPRRAGRAYSSASPPSSVRTSPTSPLRHTPVRPSGLRNQRANSLAGLGKSFQASLEDARRAVPTIEEAMTDAENGRTSPKAGLSPKLTNNPLVEVTSPVRLGGGVVAFPSVSDEDMKVVPGLDMSPSATRELAQELVAKINELRATNEEIQFQRDNLKDMLEAAQTEADELKRVCERLEHEVEVERSASGGGSDGETRAHHPQRSGLQLEIPPPEAEEPEPEPLLTGSVKGRNKNGGGALLDLAAELGAELQGSSMVPSALHVTVGLTWHGTDEGNATDAAPPVDLASELMNASKPSTPTGTTFGMVPRARRPSISTKNQGSTKRALGNRGLATRAKANPRRIRKSLSSAMFGGKPLPSPASSPTTFNLLSTPAKNKEEAEEEFVTPRSEFATPLWTPVNPTNPQQEVYLTPVSTLRVPGGLTAIAAASPVTDDDEAPEPGPSKSKEDSMMAQLRAGLDPLFNGVVKGQGGLVPPPQSSPALRRKQSQLRLLIAKDQPLEPWETKLRDLYSEIKAFEQEDPGMSSAGEDSRRFTRRARALGRLSLRRRVTGAEDYGSDYPADDSEVGDRIVKRRDEEQKRLAGFELAKKLQQKSMSTFLEVLLLVQFAVVLIVFVYTAVRRGPKAVLGNKRSR
ncbi:unnamed protein product [Rhizoctonia solani]|uniref:Uncharacterized protein n=1 Tax=Rhizoctonia solani TaxID=456999 RepID=A0A8H3AAX5_9AGAM|nr:unnamed protein product [Rhizoctonia solani]